MKRLIQLTVLGAVAAAALLAAAVLRPSATSAGAPVYSGGSALPLSALNESDMKLLETLGIQPTSVQLLGSVGGRRFYRVDGTDSRTCFAIGPAVALTYRLGVLRCYRGDAPPWVDISVTEMTRANREPHFVRVEGLAADDVAQVELRGHLGKALTRIPVVKNVYALENPPEDVATIVALDERGAEVARTPRPRG